ncbi:MAG: hypothetical protein JNK16_16775 [Phycisphaerales bacterium]|nr:hypothetical protein [Phycisphaerales bacterium]
MKPFHRDLLWTAAIAVSGISLALAMSLLKTPTRGDDTYFLAVALVSPFVLFEIFAIPISAVVIRGSLSCHAFAVGTGLALTWLCWFPLDRYAAGFPMVGWFVTPLALLATMMIVFGGCHLLIRRARRARPGHCTKCGYDLSATPAALRCPECGASRASSTPLA